MEHAIDRERDALRGALQAQRDHVLGILEGLDDDALHRAVLPSGWTCVGLVNHLALDVERFWFTAVVADRPGVAQQLMSQSDAWQVAPQVSAEEVLDLYRQEIERANTVIDETALDTPPAWWPAELFGDFRLADLRAILLHVIGETACHAGHLDAARELIDRRQWMVLT